MPGIVNSENVSTTKSQKCKQTNFNFEVAQRMNSVKITFDREDKTYPSGGSLKGTAVLVNDNCVVLDGE